MHSRKISAGLGVLLVSVFLLLAFQSNAQADSPSSGNERTLSEWLGKEIDWRPFVRVMFNYLRQNISNASNFDGVANTFMLRFQFYI
jgi:hypothetical protein